MRIEVRRLNKTFGAHRAVADVSFGIRDSEIFCLLGHNGAGKTTTMAVLSGLLPPDPPRRANDGATVFGHDVFAAGGMDALRGLLGVCPQHDVLFPKLTLEEHVYFFARLKGQSEKAANAEAVALLNVFRLSERARHLGGELSGGQKRKLSTAIALAGGSRFIILDEPTAGMDPCARRELWTLLRSVRMKRSLLLTTHHMDEAEALGDRVAIMSAGRIKTCGSAPFLKRKFGKGYLLTAHVPGASTLAFGQLVGDHVKGASIVDEDEASLVASDPLARQRAPSETTPIAQTYSLPTSDDPQRLANLFEALAASSTDTGVTTAALRASTLETVFLAVGEDADVHNVLLAGADAELYEVVAGSKGAFVADAKPTTSSKRLAAHTLAIARLRLQHARNDLVILFLPARGLERAVATAFETYFHQDCKRPLADWLGPHQGGLRCTTILLLAPIVTWLLAALCRDGLLATGSEKKYGFIPNVIVAAVCGAAYIFVPGLLAEPLVTERATRVRNLLTISGLDYRAYWLGTLLADGALLFFAAFVSLSGLAAYPLPAPKIFLVFSAVVHGRISTSNWPPPRPSSRSPRKNAAGTKWRTGSGRSTRTWPSSPTCFTTRSYRYSTTPPRRRSPTSSPTRTWRCRVRRWATR